MVGRTGDHAPTLFTTSLVICVTHIFAGAPYFEGTARCASALENAAARHKHIVAALPALDRIIVLLCGEPLRKLCRGG
jgi:hypothetical protein